MRNNIFAGQLPARWRAPFERSFGQSFAHVRAIVGREANALLAARGALALALDHKTVLLSPAWALLPETTRLAVIGHELAHTAQLARGGADESEALEAEAWQAAQAALDGRSYEIQGGAPAGAPLAAVAFVMDMFGRNYFQAYKQMGFFKVALLPITDTVVVQPMIFETLLDQMIDEFPGERFFVIWSHGNPNGFGMPIARDLSARAHAASIKVLTEVHEIKADMRKAGSDLEEWNKVLVKNNLFAAPTVAEARSMMESFIQGLVDDLSVELRVSAPLMQRVAARLTDKMFALHAKRIGIIEVRACNLGADLGSLEVFRKFFRADAIGAPDVRASFGFIQPEVGFPAFKTFTEKAQPTARKNFDKLHTGYFAIKVIIPHGSTLAHVRCAATSRLTVTEWAFNYIAWGTFNFQPEQFPIHFLVTEPPVFQGDVEYWNHVKYSMVRGDADLCSCQVSGPVAP